MFQVDVKQDCFPIGRKTSAHVSRLKVAREVQLKRGLRMRGFPFNFWFVQLVCISAGDVLLFAMFNVSKLSDRLLARGPIIHMFMCSFRPGSGDHLSGRGVVGSQIGLDVGLC